MKKLKKNIYYYFKAIISLALLLCFSCLQNTNENLNSKSIDDSKPWVYWFWTDASISKKSITRDLEAMKEIGLGGAYLFTIRGASDPPLYDPPIVQLTPEWWEMIRYAVSEADRLGLKLGIHACDGFTAAGGPWITPELSMQKVVWADTLVKGDKLFNDFLPQPETIVNYYNDIATFAYPVMPGSGVSSYDLNPIVTTSIKDKDASFIAVKGNQRRFTSDDPCWIQFEFKEPFACRSVTLQSGWNNYQANRLKIETSNDGVNFKNHGRLDSYRHGWDDRGATATHLIEPVTAKYFRFVFDPSETEPGAEDLDDAKWKPELKISGIELSGEAKIHQFEGKSGAVWRISKYSNGIYLPDSLCINPDQLINISSYCDKDGKLTWKVPEGDWVILRMGHTSTGLTNYVGGGAKGLECDKLNPEAVKIQFDNWFAKIYNSVETDIAGNVIEELYNDSWECGSQNWSPIFPEEFQNWNGYDIIQYLPVMAGVPIKNADFSERILYHIRETIAEVLVENYHGTMAKLAHEKGCRYGTECIAPVFVSDGMLHYKYADASMGEFWFRSPSHDKPNDILDAISAGHIYGKKLIRAEAGTEIRLHWDEHPGALKTLFDRNFALGVNKMVFHVFAHDPWTTRKPGKTVGVVGQFFQPNQTWWKPGKAWVKYIENCQKLLQKGNPVVDIAVFTGEEIPRRAVLPERLVPILPGIFGEGRVESEKIRLNNEGHPIRQKPKGVTTQKNIADPADWCDPLGGYKYDSFNPDVLLRFAKVEKGRIVLPGGASYALLVIPGSMKMNPNKGVMSVVVAQQLLNLIEAGATILFIDKPLKTSGFKGSDQELEKIVAELFEGERKEFIDKEGGRFEYWEKGIGKIIWGSYEASSFSGIGLDRDFTVKNKNGEYTDHIAWNHRSTEEEEIYFISNQSDLKKEVEMSFRINGKIPEFYDPVRDERFSCNEWRIEVNRTIIPYRFESNESLFIIFSEETSDQGYSSGKNRKELDTIMELNENWEVQFDPNFGGPAESVRFEKLTDWSIHSDQKIRYYSGTARYKKIFNWNKRNNSNSKVWIDLGEIANLAQVYVNEKECGIIWTSPNRIEITEALHEGENKLEIAVTNTWANRLIGDHNLPESEQITWTTAPYRLEGQPLLKAGLLGPVRILQEK